MQNLKGLLAKEAFEEFFKEFSRSLLAALMIVVVIATAVVEYMLLTGRGLVPRVSQGVGLKDWGALAVLVFAAMVGVLTWRRGMRPPAAGKARGGFVPLPQVRRTERRPPEPPRRTEGRPAAPARPPAPPQEREPQVRPPAPRSPESRTPRPAPPAPPPAPTPASAATPPPPATPVAPPPPLAPERRPPAPAPRETAPARVAPAVPVPSADQVAGYKSRFNGLLEANQFEDAEQIVAALQQVPGEEQWCHNSQEQIAFRRRRA